MAIHLHVKNPSFLSNFNEPCTFSTFSENTQISNLMEMHPVGAELFHANVETDMTKLVVAFRNFANASKTENISSCGLPLMNDSWSM